MEEIYFKVSILERMLGEISLNNEIAKEVCNLATDTKSFQSGFMLDVYFWEDTDFIQFSSFKKMICNYYSSDSRCLSNIGGYYLSI